MAKIERKEGLPEWFDLEKYKGAESFGAFEWLEQLKRRKDLLQHYPGGDAFQETHEILQDTALELWRGSIQERARQIRDNPIGASSEGMPNKWIADVPCLPIKPICVNDLAGQIDRDRWAAIERKAEKSCYNRWAAINPDIKPLPGGAKPLSPLAAISVMRGVIPSGHTDPLSIDYYQGDLASPVVQIDLNAPNTVLREAFEEFLKKIRADQSKPSKPLYYRWAEYGVLPYLDLLIWSRETGNNISQNAMAEFVTPGKANKDGRSVENFRTTTKKHAEDMMRDLSRLESLAAVEEAAKETGNV